MRQVAQQFSDCNVSPKLSPALGGQALQPELVRVAGALVELQEARHQADYDPGHRFTRREALDLIGQAEQAFSDWSSVRRSVQADTFLTGLLAFGNMRG